MKRASLAHEFDKVRRLAYTSLLPASSTQSLVAQSAERSAVNRNVVGSSPTRGARLVIGKQKALGNRQGLFVLGRDRRYDVGTSSIK